MRVLVFGDSIVQGMWDSQGGWVQRLRGGYDAKRLKDGTDEAEIINVGISGDRVKDVLDRLPNEVNFRRWFDEDFVIILSVGINDTALDQGKEITSKSEFVDQYDQLLRAAFRLTGRVIVLGITPVDEQGKLSDDGRFVYTNQRIADYDQALRNLIGEDVAFVDVQKLLGDTKNVFNDGLHPNDRGHELIAEAVKPVLDRIMAAQLET